MPTIRIDHEVFKELQKRAEPLVDTPNAVIRRLLALAENAIASGEHGRTQPSVRQIRRLPMREYELPLLESLEERGGSAPAKEVITAVGKRLASRITPLDRTTTDSGAVRWENRVQWLRLRLVERGLLKKDSPWGIWELSKAGREYLHESKAS